jgi:hypothetical protein
MAETGKPGAGDAGYREFIVTNWRPFEEDTLRAFLSLTLPCDLVLHSLTYYVMKGSRWIGPPTQRYKRDGTDSYAPVITFATESARSRSQQQALDAVDQYQDGQNE